MRHAFTLLLSLPLLLPLAALVRQLFLSESWSLDELGRWSHLAGNTLSLVGLTLTLALPPGILLGIALFRFDLPFARLFRNLLWVGLFVPLPVYVSAWQSAFGPAGWLAPDFASKSGLWKPWHEGVFSAALVHALAALPWVVFFVGLSLEQVEPAMEEDAITHTGSWRVLCRVSLRRVRPSLGFVALLLALQTAGEITVTDVMLVRTFAEEVYNQYVLDRDALAPLILLAVPQAILFAWLFSLPSRPTLGNWLSAEAHRSRYRSRLAVVPVGLFLAIYVAVPLLSLLRRAADDTFSLPILMKSMGRTFAGSRDVILESLVWAVLVGIASTFLALWFGTLARSSRWRQSVVVAVAILLLALPAPVLGFAVKEAINLVLDFEEMILGRNGYLPLRLVLYDLPSPLPVIWCQAVKFFPIAVGLLLPALNRLPRELGEQLRIGGASRWGEFRLLVWPGLRRMVAVSVLVVSLFALGEIGSSKLVEVPGRVTFAHELFRQMHYGANSTVAAFCLLAVAIAAGIGILIFTVYKSRFTRQP